MKFSRYTLFSIQNCTEMRSSNFCFCFFRVFWSADFLPLPIAPLDLILVTLSSGFQSLSPSSPPLHFWKPTFFCWKLLARQVPRLRLLEMRE